MKINKKAFDFFNNLSGFLSIDLSEKPVCIGSLMNERALSGSKITKMSLKLENADEDYRSLTKEELNQVVLEEVSEIFLIGETTLNTKGTEVCHKSKNNRFTVKDLIKAVLVTEKKTRKDTDWFGGIDVHHVYFEGLVKVRKNIFHICWGS